MAQVSEAAPAQAQPAPAAPATQAPNHELQMLKEHADRGEPPSQHLYGVRLWSGSDGSRKDDVEVRADACPRLRCRDRLALPAALSSHTCLSYQLLHTSAHITQAVAWWRKAAEQNYHPACVDLAYAYRTGRGVAKDLGEALKWYKKAADAGSVHGMYAASHPPLALLPINDAPDTTMA